MTRKNAFTLIELLVVIAIIAILAAIIFPVFARAKEAAYRSGDMSNMNAIRNALQLYRTDQGGYPPAILGYASVYASGPSTGQTIPADKLFAALYPKRIDSINTLKPAYDRNANGLITIAEWPNADNRAVGTAPIKDLDGNGRIDASDDTTGARQAYASSTASPLYFINDGSSPNLYATSDATQATKFYKVSGYDVAEVTIPPGAGRTRWELRYTLRWTNFAMNGGNRDDDPRQLIYSDPPDDTVITWNSWFREYGDNGVPAHAKKDFVLFLGGGARPYDSFDINNRSWRATP